MSDLDLLRTLSTEIVPPPLDTLRETAHTRDRRAAQTGLAVASVVLLAIGATALVSLGKDNAAPPPVVTPPATRPLTYADGATIHYGDQSVTAPGQVVEVDLTDYGVAFRTSDGRIWFTDGSTTDQLGTLGEPGSAYTELDPVSKIGFDKGWLVSDSSGSEVAWFEFPQPTSPEVVVYDSLTSEVVLRKELTVKAGAVAQLWTVDPNAAYWSDDPDARGEEATPNWQIDLATGTQTRVSLEGYQSILAAKGGARTLRISHNEGGEPVRYWYYDGIQQFGIGRRTVDFMGAQPFSGRDGLTFQDIHLRSPAGFPETNPVWLVQWLDDSTIVLSATNGDQEDLLECPIPTGTCEVVVTGPASIVAPEIG
jgi:hypothetical protein